MNNQLLNVLQQLKSNPLQFLMQSKFNIPAQVSNNPQTIINYLLRTGQVSQDAVNRAYQQVSQFNR